MRTLIAEIAGELRRFSRTVLVAVAGLFLMAVASLFSDAPVSMFFRLLSLAGTAMLLFSVVMMILVFRKASQVKPAALVVSLGVTLAALAVQLAIRGALPSPFAATLAFAAGGFIGAGWSRTRLFFVDGDIIRCRGTAWYLAVWGATFALNQFMAALAAGVPAAMTGALLVGSGIVAGSTIEQLARFYRVARLVEDLGSKPVEARR